MKNKAKADFTEDEKNWMDTVTVNYIIAQSDGYQLGYAQALHDLTENIIDYWNGSDDKPQQSILDTLIDMGVELGIRKEITKRNIETAKKRGYENHYHWEYQPDGTSFTRDIGLFTKEFEEEKSEE